MKRLAGVEQRAAKLERKLDAMRDRQCELMNKTLEAGRRYLVQSVGKLTARVLKRRVVNPCVFMQRFQQWKSCVENTRQQRQMLKSVFAKMNGFSKRDVFKAWRTFCMLRREEKSKYLTGALANARNRLEQSLAREAELRDVVDRLELRSRASTSKRRPRVSVSVSGALSDSYRSSQAALLALSSGQSTTREGGALQSGGAHSNRETHRPHESRESSGTTTNAALWELNRKLVAALAKLSKTCIGNLTQKVEEMASTQVAEVRVRVFVRRSVCVTR